VAETGRYLYAVSRDLDPAVLADFPGLGGGPLELVPYQDLVAVVSSVDLDEYGEEGLRQNLENLEWLEEAARRHDSVVQAVAAVAPAAPLRLATICLDDEGVRRRLKEWHAALVQILDRVQGRTEWSVKIFTDERRAAPVPAPAGGTAVGPDGAGAAYLQRKKSESEARLAQETAAAGAVTLVHEALARHAEATRLLPPQDPRLTGHEGSMLHNGAYLVDASREPDFVACVLRQVAAHTDVTIDLRGPWPPYSFAMLEQR
jgi:hypothetical protein